MHEPRIGPKRAWLGPILGLLASACVVPTYVPIPEDSVRQHRILGVPFFAQERAQCGPASLAMALSYAGSWTEPDQIAEQVFTEGRDGSFQFDVVGAARRRGHVPFPVDGWDQLWAEVEADHPVVVLQNLGLEWVPVWHFAVLIGFDFDQGTVTLHSGRERARTIALATFARTWRRSQMWARVILPPGQLPAQLSLERTLEAISSLERTQAWEAAERSYAAAVQRWPQSPAPSFALGNARYQLRDLRGAEAAFRAALAADASFMPALNNLAYVLVDLGDVAEARALLEAAREHAGPWRPSISRTLEELERRAAETNRKAVSSDSN